MLRMRRGLAGAVAAVVTAGSVIFGGGMARADDEVRCEQPIGRQFERAAPEQVGLDSERLAAALAFAAERNRLNVQVFRHNCLIGSSDLWVLQQDGRELSQRVQGNWRCNSGQAVLDAALLGMGLCQLPDYYVLEHLNSGALVSLLEAHQPPNTAVWALYPQQRHLSPKVRRLVDFLKEGLAGLPEYRQN